MAPILRKQAHYIIIGERRLPLIATKHPTARRLVVRYDAREETVRVTLPRYSSFKSAVEFAESKRWWLEKQMEKVARIPFVPDVVIPLFGREIRLHHVGGRGVIILEGNVMNIPGDAEFMSRRVTDWIKQELQSRINECATIYAKKLGVTIRRITLRETTSRWGSCSSKGTLSFCWRIAFAPREVMEYLVCHEVCHLREHNHGLRYWKLVEGLCPDYQNHEAWLDQHGPSLWHYG